MARYRQFIQFRFHCAQESGSDDVVYDIGQLAIAADMDW